eukprot:TRINITY_DN2332_c0_g1_i1.p1 TRINITY_DN2332_c0_g1~~TRINITY_DN2332_c0_g1_i1.p1  ORF type:complete len:391 (-),score=62.55 TRINITY_DN2332_c0_g1_i1:1478-2650(-)
MGFLSAGKTLSWEEAQKYAKYIQEHGIIQFLNILEREKGRRNDPLMWGEEIEYIIVEVDDSKKDTRLSLRGDEILHELSKEDETSPTATAAWRPEYGSFMLEGTPARPYGDTIEHFLYIQSNMTLRRRIAQKYLKPNERVFSLTTYPLMGANNFTSPTYPVNGPTALSSYVPDEAINSHFRFRTLTANIRQRRESKVDINMPLFRDTNTTGLGNNIHMDCMAFGMGCCCLQCTFQAKDINEARLLYDQFAVIAPIMLALTAATPVLRGLLADTDVRWKVISDSVDDRAPGERGLEPLKNGQRRIPKSRYDSISTFISLHNHMKPKYNDINLVINDDAFKTLKEQGVDELLARHISHLFIRDPLVIYDDKIYIDDSTHSDHFEVDVSSPTY